MKREFLICLLSLLFSFFLLFLFSLCFLSFFLVGRTSGRGINFFFGFRFIGSYFLPMTHTWLRGSLSLDLKKMRGSSVSLELSFSTNISFGFRVVVVWKALAILDRWIIKYHKGIQNQWYTCVEMVLDFFFIWGLVVVGEMGSHFWFWKINCVKILLMIRIIWREETYFFLEFFVFLNFSNVGRSLEIGVSLCFRFTWNWNMRKWKMYKNLKLIVSIYLFVMDDLERWRRQLIIFFGNFLLESGLQSIVSTSYDIRSLCKRIVDIGK